MVPLRGERNGPEHLRVKRLFIVFRDVPDVDGDFEELIGVFMVGVLGTGLFRDDLRTDFTGALREDNGVPMVGVAWIWGGCMSVSSSAY